MSNFDRVQEQVDCIKLRGADNDKLTAAVWQQVAAAQKSVPKRPDCAPYLGRYRDA